MGASQGHLEGSRQAQLQDLNTALNENAAAASRDLAANLRRIGQLEAGIVNESSAQGAASDLAIENGTRAAMPVLQGYQRRSQELSDELSSYKDKARSLLGDTAGRALTGCSILIKFVSAISDSIQIPSTDF